MTALTALIGVTYLAAGLSGYQIGKASAWQRGVLVAQFASARAIRLRDTA
jgi:hypothetical protein